MGPAVELPGSKTYAQKVIAHRPPSAADACWDADGNKIEEVNRTGNLGGLFP